MQVAFLACLAVVLVLAPAAHAQVWTDGAGTYHDWDCGDWIKNDANNKCYQMYITESSWSDASDACLADGASLVTVPGTAVDDASGAAINTFLLNLAAGSDVWLGGFTDVTSTSGFAWIDMGTASYTNWAENQPEKSFNTMCLLNGLSGTWTDESPDDQHAFICQKGGNIAQGPRAVYQWTQYGDNEASRAVDGGYNMDMNGDTCVQTQNKQDPWWAVDLGLNYDITAVVVTNRNKRKERLHNFNIFVTSDDNNFPPESSSSGADLMANNWIKCGEWDPENTLADFDTATLECAAGSQGRYLAVAIFIKTLLHFCEIDVFGTPLSLAVEPLSAATSYLGHGDWFDYDCEDGWTGFGQHCYKKFDAATFDAALANCMSEEATLVTFPGSTSTADNFNNETVIAINNFMQSTFLGDDVVWLGGYIAPVYGMKWVDAAADTEYTNWAEDEPNQGAHACLVMEQSGEWGDRICTDPHEYVCRKGGNIVIGPRDASQVNTYGNMGPNRAIDGIRDTVVEDGSCAHTLNDATESWWAIDMGMIYSIDAAVLTNRNRKQERLTNFVVAVTNDASAWPIPTGNDGWASINNTWTRCGMYPGNPGAEATLVCSPSVTGRYLAIYVDPPAYNMLHFCEADIYGSPVGLAVTPDTTPICPDGWMTYRNRCYKTFASALGWNDAQADCLANGASLAAVHDEYTETNLLNLMSENGVTDVWIGGEVYIGGEFTWYDDSVEDYLNWNSSPDGTRGCVHMTSDGWLQEDCSVAKSYICQFGGNIALNGDAWQSSLYLYQNPVAKNAVDGDINPKFADSCSSTRMSDSNAWWAVDLGQTYEVKDVYIVNREDSQDQLANATIVVSDARPNDDTAGSDWNLIKTYAYCAQVGGDPGDMEHLSCEEGATGRHLYIYHPQPEVILTLCEVEVFGIPLGWDCRLPGCTNCSADGESCYECVDGLEPSGDGLKCVTASCECSGSGDVHWYSCDNTRIDFQGDCSYVVSVAGEDCMNDFENITGLTPYRVWVDQHKLSDGARVAYVNNVFIDVYGHEIQLFWDTQKYDGVEFSLPFIGDFITITTTDSFRIVQTDFGLQVKYKKDNTWSAEKAKNSVYVKIPASYQENICGICGNFNGDSDDDCYAKGGDTAVSDTAVGDSWYMENEHDTGSCVVTTDPDSECADLSAGEAVCEKIKTDASLQTCRDLLGEDVYIEYFNNCAFDVCLVTADGEADDGEALCAQAEAMVHECNQQMSTPIDWRDAFGCPLECEENRVYQYDIQFCPASCQQPDTQEICFETAAEGCVCDDGWLRSGVNCIHSSECGCIETIGNDTLYHELGEEWSSETCARNYICENQTISIVSDGCTSHASCTEQDEVTDCYCDEGFIGVGYSHCQVDCTVGQTEGEVDPTVCEPCAIGSYKDETGPGDCTICDDILDGTFTTSDTGSASQSECLEICTLGHQPNPDNLPVCEECALNFYKSEDGRGACLACDEGFITDNTGSVSEDLCLKVCGLGESPDGAGGCAPCALNTYKDLMGRSACTPCDDEGLTEATGTVSAEQCNENCALGETGVADSALCEPCPIGTFKNLTGRGECTACPEDHGTLTVGSISPDACLKTCGPGQTGEGSGTDCIACAENTYKAEEGRQVCTACPEGTSTEGATGSDSPDDCVEPTTTTTTTTTTLAPTTTPEPPAETTVEPDTKPEKEPRVNPINIKPVYERIPCDNPQGCHDNATCTDESSENGFCECNEESRCGDGVNVCKDQCICRVMGDPVVNTDDGQMILLTDPGLYKMSSDLVNASDACSFSVAVKVTPVVRQQRIMYAASMPRYLRIEFCGLVIHLDQNFRAMIGSEVIEVGTEPMEFAQDTFGGQCAFSISKVQTDVNGEQNFIVLDSPTCGFHVGFEGDGINSVAVIKRPCNPHGGRMTGLCGDCNGVADDLKTCDTGSDVSREADPYTAVSESCRTDDSMDEWQQTFGEDVNAK